MDFVLRKCQRETAPEWIFHCEAIFSSIEYDKYFMRHRSNFMTSSIFCSRKAFSWRYPNLYHSKCRMNLFLVLFYYAELLVSGKKNKCGTHIIQCEFDKIQVCARSLNSIQHQQNSNCELMLNWTSIGAELNLDWNCLGRNTNRERRKSEFELRISFESRMVRKSRIYHEFRIFE